MDNQLEQNRNLAHENSQLYERLVTATAEARRPFRLRVPPAPVSESRMIKQDVDDDEDGEGEDEDEDEEADEADEADEGMEVVEEGQNAEMVSRDANMGDIIDEVCRVDMISGAL